MDARKTRRPRAPGRAGCAAPSEHAVTALAWAPPPDSPLLRPDEVHVWRASLADAPHAGIATLWRLLSTGERRRAYRLLGSERRRRFVVARGLLRLILERYLAVPAARLRFEYGAHGKPSLLEVGNTGAGELRFNVSHSDDLVLYALARGRRVGIDIERVRANLDTGAIARRYFSPPEVKALAALPRAERARSFFECWTRKEAYVKATGAALATTLSRVVVSVTPAEPVALLRVDGDAEAAARWRLRSLDAASDYAAALAVEGHGWRLASWQWPPDFPYDKTWRSGQGAGTTAAKPDRYP